MHIIAGHVGAKWRAACGVLTFDACYIRAEATCAACLATKLGVHRKELAK